MSFPSRAVSRGNPETILLTWPIPNPPPLAIVDQEFGINREPGAISSSIFYGTRMLFEKVQATVRFSLAHKRSPRVKRTRSGFLNSTTRIQRPSLSPSWAAFFVASALDARKLGTDDRTIPSSTKRFLGSGGQAFMRAHRAPPNDHPKDCRANPKCSRHEGETLKSSRDHR